MTTIVTPDGLRAAPGGKSSPIPAGSRRSIGASAGRVDLLTRDVVGGTYEAMYRSQPWVATVVNKLVKSAARLPLKTFVEGGDDGNDRQRIRKGTLPDLLAHPYPRGSAWGLKAFVVWNKAVHGNALLAKWRPGPGQPVAELWPIPWRHVEVVHDGRRMPIAFIYHGVTGETVALSPEDVVHFAWLGYDGMVGMSPMEPLRRTLALEHAAQEWSASYFANAATPSGAFIAEKELKQGSIERLRVMLEETYGGIENAGKIAVLDNDVKWQGISATPVDAGLVEQRKLSREEVCAVYDIPPPLVGILDRATFSNITELHKALYVDTMGPILTMLEQTFATQLVEGETVWADQFVEFDYGDLLRPDLVQRAQSYRLLLESGYTLNEIRRMENLPAIETPEADVPMVPLNLVPIDAAGDVIRDRAGASAVVGPGRALPTPGDAPTTLEP